MTLARVSSYLSSYFLHLFLTLLPDGPQFVLRQDVFKVAREAVDVEPFIEALEKAGRLFGNDIVVLYQALVVHKLLHILRQPLQLLYLLHILTCLLALFLFDLVDLFLECLLLISEFTLHLLLYLRVLFVRFIKSNYVFNFFSFHLLQRLHPSQILLINSVPNRVEVSCTFLLRGSQLSFLFFLDQISLSGDLHLHQLCLFLKLLLDFLTDDVLGQLLGVFLLDGLVDVARTPHQTIIIRDHPFTFSKITHQRRHDPPLERQWLIISTCSSQSSPHSSWDGISMRLQSMLSLLLQAMYSNWQLEVSQEEGALSNMRTKLNKFLRTQCLPQHKSDIGSFSNAAMRVRLLSMLSRLYVLPSSLSLVRCKQSILMQLLTSSRSEVVVKVFNSFCRQGTLSIRVKYCLDFMKTPLVRFSFSSGSYCQLSISLAPRPSRPSIISHDISGLFMLDAVGICFSSSILSPARSSSRLIKIGVYASILLDSYPSIFSYILGSFYRSFHCPFPFLLRALLALKALVD